MKTTAKIIAHTARELGAEDITRADFNRMRAIREAEGGLSTVLYSHGAYGVNAVLLKGNTSGKLYAITARTSALFMI